MTVLVLRGSIGGLTHGVGVCDSFGGPFRFPAVGESFEAPGPELVPIREATVDGVVRNVPDDQCEHGIHGYWWGHTGWERGAIGEFSRWALGEYLVLEADERDVVHDKWRTTVGKVRVKRGCVRFRGDLRGAIDYMRASWPSENGPPPAWEDDPALFPPPPPAAKPITWTRNHLGWTVPAP